MFMKPSLSSPELQYSLKLRKYHNYDNGVLKWKHLFTPAKGPKMDVSNRSVVVGLVLAGLVVLFLMWDIWIKKDTQQADSIVTKKSDSPLIITSKEIIFEIGTGSFVTITPRKPLKYAAVVNIQFDDPDIVETIGTFTIQKNSTRSIFIPLHSKKVAGHCTMSFRSTSMELKDLFKIQIHIKVVHEVFLGYVSIILGWLYFICWSALYYPQIYKNYERRSVVGLSFDYLALNMTGHLCYCVFNTAMYYNSSVQKDYTKLHPKGLLPVKINDVFFSYHAVTMNCILILQCIYYERGGQKLSVSNIALTGGLWITMIVGLIFGITERITWLRYLYYLSYIKVGTTPIKYGPQVYLHYIKQSTEGWSIHSVLFDFTGGCLCLCQMTLDAINNDDWDGTLGNPGKLGLSMIALIFDTIFITQHYGLYPQNRKKPRTEEWHIEFKQKLNDLQMSLPAETSKKYPQVYEL